MRGQESFKLYELNVVSRFSSPGASRRAQTHEMRRETEPQKICFVTQLIIINLNWLTRGILFQRGAHLNKIGRWLTCCNTYFGNGSFSITIFSSCSAPIPPLPSSSIIIITASPARDWYLYYSRKTSSGEENEKPIKLRNKTINKFAKRLERSLDNRLT